jgi:hypothetical protein
MRVYDKIMMILAMKGLSHKFVLINQGKVDTIDNNNETSE